MRTYRDYSINEKINAKGNDRIEFNASRLMEFVKKNWIVSSGSKLKLESDGINSNRNHKDEN